MDDVRRPFIRIGKFVGWKSIHLHEDYVRDWAKPENTRKRWVEYTLRPFCYDPGWRFLRIWIWCFQWL